MQPGFAGCGAAVGAADVDTVGAGTSAVTCLPSVPSGRVTRCTEGVSISVAPGTTWASAFAAACCPERYKIDVVDTGCGVESTTSTEKPSFFNCVAFRVASMTTSAPLRTSTVTDAGAAGVTFARRGSAAWPVTDRMNPGIAG